MHSVSLAQENTIKSSIEDKKGGTGKRLKILTGIKSNPLETENMFQTIKFIQPSEIYREICY